MHQPSVQKVLDLGNEMLASLESADVDRFSTLLERRGRLVRHMAADLSEAGLSSDETAALAVQSQKLEEAMRSTRVALGAAVSAVSQFRTARGSYRQQPGVREGILNKSLHG